MRTEDSILINKCLKHDEVAQRELYLKYRIKWYILCQRYAKSKFEADDILQEGLIGIFKSLDQYDSKRGHFSTWSCRVIVNAALRYLKKSTWQSTFLELEGDHDIHSLEETIYDQLAQKELVALLQTLPTGYRLVFNMYVIEGYAHQEIADSLGINVGTSKSQLSKARKMLRDQLENHLIS